MSRTLTITDEMHERLEADARAAGCQFATAGEKLAHTAGPPLPDLVGVANRA